MLKRRFGLSIFVYLFALLVGCSGKKAVDSSKEGEETTKRVIPVRIKKVSGESFVEYGEFLGEVLGISQAPLISYAGGRVSKVLGREGQDVKEGEKLCDIDGETYDVQLDSARLAKQIAASTLRRRRVAVKRGAASRLQLDQATGDFLKAKQKEIESKKVRDGAFCVSPISGTVVERLIRDFQVVGQQSPTFVVADLDQMIVRFGIPENEIQGYKIGDIVSVSLSAYPGRIWEGKLSSLAQSVNAQGRTFLAEATIDNPDHILKPGLTARLKVERYSFQEKVIIPQTSILTSGKQQFVYVVEDGVARKKEIVVQAGNKKLSVIKTGLSIGDSVIVGGHLLAGDGAKVRVLEEKSKQEKAP